MRLLKTSLKVIFSLLILGLLFRGPIYRYTITYKPIRLRKTYKPTNPKLIQYIDKKSKPNIQAIIKKSLSLTSKKLHFTSNKNDIDPNKLIKTKSAHCVGYASFFATTCNSLLQQNNLDSIWTAQPQAAQLYLFGHNIHHYFDSPFFKDHDFVIIKNKKSGEILAVDPSLYDYFFVGLVTTNLLAK